ncbi:MAG: zinc ribbon domain-containing protein [Chitinispirillales bacterium]|jgi:ribosomal protein L40E|nr:zinc ribbon domain-containing protein [Chitinispirillales bacterium]
MKEEQEGIKQKFAETGISDRAEKREFVRQISVMQITDKTPEKSEFQKIIEPSYEQKNFCEKCGKQINISAEFCRFCGHPQETLKQLQS